MSIQEILSQRKQLLGSVIRDSFMTNRHTDGFALRLLSSPPKVVEPILGEFGLGISPDAIAYNGYPEVAYLGFGIACTPHPADEAIDVFLHGVRRLYERSGNALTTLSADDLALLGIADGFSRIVGCRSGSEIDEIQSWLSQIIDQSVTNRLWTYRARVLSGELVGMRGHLAPKVTFNSIDEMAIEIALRSIWPIPFQGQKYFDVKDQNDLLKALLTAQPPEVGEIDRAVVWLRALDVLLDSTTKWLLPSISDTAQLLSNIQTALKRWVWKDNSRRRNADPSRWLIDEESDVQALLWTILYPIFGKDLVDETYLPNYGFVQPRVDLGILKLKLIIEVKMVREPSNFAEFEGQIGEDIGLYFKDLDLFDRMIVFVYDDCDHPQPERYGVFRDTLLKRGGGKIEDVVIVQRPSMIPNRNQRKSITV